MRQDLLDWIQEVRKLDINVTEILGSVEVFEEFLTEDEICDLIKTGKLVETNHPNVWMLSVNG